ncbi:Sugar kinase of the NBD/HSP70 family, may contain an N-terminal HTH domain [Amycolatopsis tolypomycina]|uniref:Sugar kinase of the NBD/HSP70 family, may contain an N-terminal HTH domain n=1 Tax=Amycolatopsis tolypomycina TaxID=208445 RepID=A0A1H4TMZ4_9PSEU|nr:ROK family transcriptional regulator [Amycolatopsis tolypomycina]SEC57600.1 Sugar kinase of the NBD/HSP70 family, may contain an N-terminal HTH domain [Amycolatopsis tolypomycina]
MAVTRTRQAGSASPRTANLAAVLRALRTGPLSRTQLAARCGIPKSAVPGLLAELAERGLVRPAGVRPGNGRPSRLVELHGEDAYALALTIEADRLSALVTDLSGRVLAEGREAVDVAALGLHAGLDALAHLAGRVLPGLPVGVAVSVPGLVDSAAAVLRFAPALRWRDAEIAGLLAARLALPVDAVAVDNEANLGALAESVAGTGTELFFLNGGTAVGGGFVSGGTILRGARGFAGEVGHIAVDPSGERCPCGRTGCLETKANLAAVLRAAAAPGDPLHDPAPGIDGRVALLKDRVRRGDQRAATAVHELGVALGIALSTVVDVLDPDVVVLGGFFAELGEWLVEPVRVELAARPLGQARVVASGLGLQAPLRGAAHLAAERLFANPTLAEEATV